MSTPFVGEIRAVAFNFVPRGWAACDGQLLPIAQHTALFALLGTYYGGDGKATFALPNLRGRSPVGTGGGAVTHEHELGEEGGSETVALVASEMPAHTHFPLASPDPGELQAPAPDRALARSAPGQAYHSAAPNTALHPQALAVTGAGQPHNNMPPVLEVHFVIALEGEFPQRP